MALQAQIRHWFYYTYYPSSKGIAFGEGNYIADIKLLDRIWDNQSHKTELTYSV